jgi:hypothetical protein
VVAAVRERMAAVGRALTAAELDAIVRGRL